MYVLPPPISMPHGCPTWCTAIGVGIPPNAAPLERVIWVTPGASATTVFLRIFAKLALISHEKALSNGRPFAWNSKPCLDISPALMVFAENPLAPLIGTVTGAFLVLEL